jgi:hypothetical protein
MDLELKKVVEEIDNIIKDILPHTGIFRKEVKLLLKKEEYFKEIDKIAQKYDELIASLSRESK